MKAAGHDLVIVETPGIGQGDAGIVPLVDHSLYVMTPEFGAASQLEKIDMLDFADVVAINVNLRAGVMDERAYPDGTQEATDRKLGWIRDAAGDRFRSLVLQARVHLAMVTDDRTAVLLRV